MELEIKNKDPEYISTSQLKRGDVCVLVGHTKHKIQEEENLLTVLSASRTPLYICICGTSLVATCMGSGQVVSLSFFEKVDAKFKLCESKLNVTIL